MDSSSNYLFRQMGICKIKNKESKLAIPYFERAIQHDSMDIKSYEYLSMIYRALGESDKALNILEKAIKHDPLNSELYHRIGDIHFAQNHNYRAIPVYLKALELGNNSPWLVKNLGTSYYNIINFIKAKEYLFIANLLFTDQGTLHLLGKTYLELNQPDSASIFLQFSLDLLLPESSTLYSLYNDLALSFKRKQEYQKAIQVNEKIYEIEFNEYGKYYYSNQANINIARIYEQNLNNKKKAIEYYMKIIDNKSKYNHPNQIKYAQDRVKKLKEELFFEGEIDKK